MDCDCRSPTHDPTYSSYLQVDATVCVPPHMPVLDFLTTKEPKPPRPLVLISGDRQRF